MPLLITDKAILVDINTGIFLAHGVQITATGGLSSGGSGFTSASSLAHKAKAYVVKVSADACGPRFTKDEIKIFDGIYQTQK